MDSKSFVKGKKYEVILNDGHKMKCIVSDVKNDLVLLGAIDDTAGRWFKYSEIKSAKNVLF